MCVPRRPSAVHAPQRTRPPTGIWQSSLQSRTTLPRVRHSLPVVRPPKYSLRILHSEPFSVISHLTRNKIQSHKKVYLPDATAAVGGHRLTNSLMIVGRRCERDERLNCSSAFAAAATLDAF